MDGIVKKLTDERKKRGISQAKLAQMCGMPQSTVGRIESGAVAPNISTVEHMAGALGLDLSVEEKRPRFAAGWDGLHAMCYWKDEPVSEIYVRGNDVTVKRFTHHPVKQIFSRDRLDVFALSEVFRRRCWEEDRDGMDDLLKRLGLTHYDPLGIVRKTHGVSYNDFLWFQFDGEKLFWRDVAPRNRNV